MTTAPMGRSDILEKIVTTKAQEVIAAQVELEEELQRDFACARSAADGGGGAGGFSRAPPA